MEIESATYNPLVGKLEIFLRDEYFSQIQKLSEKYPEEKSLEIDYKKLDKFNIDLADELLENPTTILDAIQKAIKDIDVGTEITDFEPHIRFINLPKEEKHLIGNINSSHLNKMIAVEGVVRMMVDVLPKIKIASWRCKKCGRVYRIPQTSLDLSTPGFCECDRKEFDLMPEESLFVDFQKIQIQEPLEYMKGGEQAKYIEVYLEDDLTNKLTPGARIEIIGILKLRPPTKRSSVYGRYIETNNF
ncbi:MAG: minichromosome maintenance protein MCM, partial [Candidatus Diapherotrites archaeon]|nr:minichromosome maintenance protein MCM [Candidatus Diapherotrites archaeon]